MMKFTIGREDSNDCIIYDPEKFVSRFHAEIVVKDLGLFVTDLNSTNGTFVNNTRLTPNSTKKITLSDKITFGKKYPFNPMSFPQISNALGGKKVEVEAPDKTMVFQTDEKTMIFDSEKTQISELAKFTKVESVVVGRGDGVGFKLNGSNVSRKHCQVKYVSESLFEIEDLGSANGTFVDDQKLAANKKYTFSSAAKIICGTTALKISDVLPNLLVIEKKISKSERPTGPITQNELEEFNRLEVIWKEYDDRMKRATKLSQDGGIWSSAFSIAHLIPGIGPIIGISGMVMTRYLVQKKSNELRGDENYEDMFLEVYSCPRCKNTFGKKRWSTIKECLYCKIKFK
jgi:pSer/pThr/pTyr-binding forkhead associated (FHA) protein